MDEIKYELTNLDEVVRTMRDKGTHKGASGYEEVWLGKHSGIDVWAGIDCGNYSAYGDTGRYLSETYTEKQLRNYDNYLSAYDIEQKRGRSWENKLWGLVDVKLYFYVFGIEVCEEYLLATKQEFGFSPEANIVALDEPQHFGLVEVVKNALRGSESLFDYAVRRAVMEAKSLASEIARAIE